MLEEVASPLHTHGAHPPAMPIAIVPENLLVGALLACLVVGCIALAAALCYMITTWLPNPPSHLSQWHTEGSGDVADPWEGNGEDEEEEGDEANGPAIVVGSVDTEVEHVLTRRIKKRRCADDEVVEQAKALLEEVD